MAKAASFPRTDRTSTTGLASADLGTLVDSPSRIASAAGISVPSYEGGRRSGGRNSICITHRSCPSHKELCGAPTTLRAN